MFQQATREVDQSVVEVTEEYWPELGDAAATNQTEEMSSSPAFSHHPYCQTLRLFSDDDDTATNDDAYIHNTLKIYSVKDLTLLDMIGLANGSYDATGNRVWMGAVFFVEVFARYSGMTYKDLNEKIICNTHGISLAQLRRELFHEKKVLELGCGTGLCSLSLLKVGEACSLDDSVLYKPTSVTLTDGDNDALKLSKQNFEVNNLNKKFCTWKNVQWGEICFDSSEVQTVIAADVLYDISSLHPLLSTASQVLLTNGYFILSHIPRADVRRNRNESHQEALERIVISAAKEFGLELAIKLPPIIRPDIFGIYSTKFIPLLHHTLDDFKEVGAAILIFQKK